MWAYVALGPLAQIAPPDTTTTEPPPTWYLGENRTANTTIMVTLISVIAGSVVISCVCVGLWMYYQNEKYAVRVGTADEEVVERSEGGYRTKRKIIPGQAPNESQAPARPSCLERCCNRLCPKKKVRRIAPVAQDSGGSLVLGARVRLVGLSQAHFNGLEGFITGGPNDKGRYTVDVIVDDDEMVREMQTLSFKPDNLLVLPPENANANLQAMPGRGPSSYRGGA
ncbi:unnamed protein product [Effrenium voratum]|nr:unnamed protein product [Effrenium voratum]